MIWTKADWERLFAAEREAWRLLEGKAVVKGKALPKPKSNKPPTTK
jgi:hypothetical protein